MRNEILEQIPALRAYSRLLCRSVPDAEDLVQKTLLRAIDHADSFRPGINLRGWLFAIMRECFHPDGRRSGQPRLTAQDGHSAPPRDLPQGDRSGRCLG